VNLISALQPETKEDYIQPADSIGLLNDLELFIVFSNRCLGVSINYTIQTKLIKE